MKYILILLLFLPSLSIAADKIDPSQDLTYEGAFVIPSDDGAGHAMTYGTHAIAFDPGGNEGAGSLFVTSRRLDGYVCEIAIPALVKSTSWSALNTATILQTCGDLSDGKVVIGGIVGTTDKIYGMVHLPAQGDQTSDKIYMAVNEYFSPELDKTTIGWAETTISSPSTAGWWDVAGLNAGQTSQYLCEIDATWATTNTGGKILGIGRDRVQGGGSSRGPTLYATAPWADGNPPADGSSLTATTILAYSDEHPVNRYSNGELPSGSFWLKIGTKEALVIVGTEDLRNSAEFLGGTQTYGNAREYECGDKGFQGSPNYLGMRFYDPDDLATAMSSGNPYDPQPYAWFNFIADDLLGTTCRSSMFGATYDKTGQMIFIVEQTAAGASLGNSVVYVFSLNDVSSSLDTTAPTVPSDVSFNEGTTTLTWTASTDTHDITYIIYRRLPVKVGEYGTGIWYENPAEIAPWVQTLITAGTIYAGDVYYQYTADDSILYQDYPVGMSTTNSWVDTEYVSFSYHEFKVSAMDENGNESDKSGGSPAVVNSALSFGAGGSSIAIGGSSSFVIQ